MAILESPKSNHPTTFFGYVFIAIAVVMYLVKYIIPAFVTLKQEMSFEWYAPVIVNIIGLVLIFINEDYFSKIFNRADKIVGKKTDTE